MAARIEVIYVASPYHLTNAEFAGIIKNQLLDSASPLVGEGGMVNLQFTPKLSRKETSDISNMPIHINRLESLSLSQLITFCKMFGISSIKPKDPACRGTTSLFNIKSIRCN
ncbi:hypothetical protein BASA50_010996 [Batrachochytrium salamandrivorans]|uniref:Uncharacterized protein n=1 Tax=Batrachochytrium salamandrivorans TaxID=1357716 RepID=A0ABQ8EX29_9FUNG|nr:hypothetical protein BASA50_010996 [Batrachochytrium salamandrivorans]